jgi:hypothetical protein
MEGWKQELDTLIPCRACPLCPEPLQALASLRYVDVTSSYLGHNATMIELAILREFHRYDVATTGRSTGRGSSKANFSYAESLAIPCGGMRNHLNGQTCLGTSNWSSGVDFGITSVSGRAGVTFD